MKTNLPQWANVLLFFTIALLHAVCVLDEWYTITWLLVIQGLVAGWAIAGFSYEVFAGKKAIEATKESLKNTTPYQQGGSTPAERAKGYWIWTLILMLAGAAIPLAKIILV